jgi:YD repeat-containing protein
LGLFAGQTAWAQGDIFDAKGARPNRGAFSALPFEHVDLASGNVMLTFVDLSLPGNAGRSLRLQRTFNSKAPFQQGGSGWTFGIAGQVMRVVIPQPPNFEQFYMSDGGVILAQLADTLGGPWRATDQFWRFNRQTRQLFTPDGTVSTFDDQGRLTRTEDQFGNVVELIYGPNNQLVIRQHVSETQVREVVVQLRTDGLPETMTYEGRTWTYEGAGGADSAVLPEGVTWTFEYPGTYEHPVVIVHTPQGGQIRYDLHRHEFPTYGGGSNTYGSAVVDKRTVTLAGASFEWIVTYGGGLGWTATTVRAPDQTYTTLRHEFRENVLPSRSYVETQRGRFDADDVEIEHEDLLYTNIVLRGTDGGNTPQVPVPSARQITRGGRTYSRAFSYRFSDYGDYHQPATVQDSVDGTWVRTLAREYEYPSGVFVLGLVKKEWVSVDNQTVEVNRTYDSLGFQESDTAPHLLNSAGVITTFSRTAESRGNVDTITPANGKATTFTYSFGQMQTETRGGVSVARVINPDGSVASETVGGRTTAYTYDDLGRIETVDPPADSEVATTTYAPDGTWVKVERGSSATTTYLDGFGRPIRTENGAGAKTLTTYDAEGRVTCQSYPLLLTGTTDCWAANRTTFAYDALGRVTTETNPDGVRTRTYDDAANRVTVTDEEGHQTRLTYQAFGHPDDARLIALRDAVNLALGDDGQDWTYTYDTVGNLRTVSGPGGVQREWVYTANNLLAQETHPESGTVQYTTYDAAGVLKGKTDANGTAYGYTHDDRDRLKTVTAGGQTVVEFDYEPGSDNRAVMSGAGVSATFQYDAAGRLALRTDTVDGKTFGVGYDYDTRDNLIKLRYPSGREVLYDYDAENRLEEIYENGSLPYASAFTYHPSGAVATYTSGNQLETTVGLDARQRVAFVSVPNRLGLTYHYDAVGNVERIDDARDPGWQQTFTYDVLDRLKSSQGPYGVVPNYPYDAHGNRQGDGFVYEPGNPFRLQSFGGLSVGYDNNGNLTTGGPSTYTYGQGNRLLSASVAGVTTVFAYDGDDWRVKQQSGCQTTYSIRGPNGQLLSEWTQSPVASEGRVREYVYAGARLVAIASRAAEALAPCNNRLMPGQTLTANQTRTSPNGRYQLQFQEDGNLVLLDLQNPGGEPPWGSNTHGTGAVQVLMQEDGNLVIRRADLSVVKHTSTHQYPGAYLEVLDDGRLIVYAPSGAEVWHRGLPLLWPVEDTLEAGQSLIAGEARWSPNRQYRLRYQHDGNLVLTDTATAQDVWGSATNPAAPGAVTMETNGNLVIRNGSNQIQKHTNTAGHPGAVLKVLDDGSLVIVEGGSALWDSSEQPLLTAPPTGDHVLGSDEFLSAGGERRSLDQRYLLAYQGSDGNVVLYDTEASPWYPIWASDTVGTSLGVLAMQGDGNFVLYDANEVALRASGTVGNTGAYLVVTDDGRLIIYTAAHEAIWYSDEHPSFY